MCCWAPCWCLYCCWLVSIYFWHPYCYGSPFCCWCCDVPIVSATVSLPPCCSQLHLQASLLLVASILCWRSCCCFNSCCCFSAVVSGHRTIGLWLSDCHFFLLSNYQNIKYCIGQLKKVPDYQISDQGLNLLDYRISDSEKTSGCTPLQAWLRFSTCWGKT